MRLLFIYIANLTKMKAHIRLRRDWAKKEDDEQKALQLCQSKVRQKKLPMQVVDCEFQWLVSSISRRSYTSALTVSAGIDASSPFTLLRKPG